MVFQVPPCPPESPSAPRVKVPSSALPLSVPFTFNCCLLPCRSNSHDDATVAPLSLTDVTLHGTALGSKPESGVEFSFYPLLPANSRMVGKKSILDTGVSHRVPGLTAPGQRTIKGSRMPPSYR